MAKGLPLWGEAPPKASNVKASPFGGEAPPKAVVGGKGLPRHSAPCARYFCVAEGVVKRKRFGRKPNRISVQWLNQNMSRCRPL